MSADASHRQQAHDALRRQNRARRAALQPAEQRAAARALAARILGLPAYLEAERIAAYLAIRGEIDLGAVIDDALARGKQLYLPVLRGRQMRFAPYCAGQSLRQGSFGLREPEVDDRDSIDPTRLDLVLAPLTVFDAAGNRIGQGGGFYDRAFAFRREAGVDKPLLLGVAHELQKVEHIDANAWDVPLDGVATDAALY